MRPLFTAGAPKCASSPISVFAGDIELMSHKSDGAVSSSSYYGEEDDPFRDLSPSLTDNQSESNLSSILSGVNDLDIADEPRSSHCVTQCYSERRAGSGVEYLRREGFASLPRQSTRARYEHIAENIRTPEEIQNFVREMSSNLDLNPKSAKKETEQVPIAAESGATATRMSTTGTTISTAGAASITTGSVTLASTHHLNYCSQPKSPERYYHTTAGIRGCLSHMHHCSLKPFEHSNTNYNLLIAGQPGTGKSTISRMLVNAKPNGRPVCQEHQDSLSLTVDYLELILHDQLAVPYLTKVTEVLKKNFQTITLSVVDTCHHGGNIDARAKWHRHSDYLLDELKLYYLRESQPDRRAISDCRIHACVYFLSPDTAQLSIHDIHHMKELSEVTSLVLVVGKADSLTPNETDMRREIIKLQLSEHGIKCYQPRGAKEVIDYPLFVIATDEEFCDKYNKPIPGRKVGPYIIDTFDDRICDNNTFQRILFDDYMLDIIGQTSDKYENARRKLCTKANLPALLPHYSMALNEEVPSSLGLAGTHSCENENNLTYCNLTALSLEDKAQRLVHPVSEEEQLREIIAAYLNAEFRLKMEPLNSRLDQLDDLSLHLKDERAALIEEIAQLQVEVSSLEQFPEFLKPRRRFNLGRSSP